MGTDHGDQRAAMWEPPWRPLGLLCGIILSVYEDRPSLNADPVPPMLPPCTPPAGPQPSAGKPGPLARLHYTQVSVLPGTSRAPGGAACQAGRCVWASSQAQGATGAGGRPVRGEAGRPVTPPTAATLRTARGRRPHSGRRKTQIHICLLAWKARSPSLPSLRLPFQKRE